MSGIRRHIAALILVLSCLYGSISAQDDPLELLNNARLLGESIILSPENKVNTGLWEYSPMFYSDGLVFIGTRRNFKVIDPSHGTPFYTLKFASFNPEGGLNAAVPFRVVEKNARHYGPVTFLNDENTLVFSRSISDSDRQNERVPLHLYKADRVGEEWVIDTSFFQFQNPEYSYLHPAYDPQSNAIYFSSNMRGGKGGMDLYKVELSNDGTPSTPTLLPENINTGGNEVFPYLMNGVLFFSSDEGKEKTGLDIYASHFRDGEWTEPLRLPSPFNSREDDFGLILADDLKSGYFSTSRKGGKGEDDILKFSMEVPLIYPHAENHNFSITVTDEESKKRLEEIGVWVFEADPNGLAKNKDYYETRFERIDDGELSIRFKLKDLSQLPEPMTYTDHNGIAQLAIDKSKSHVLVVGNQSYPPGIELLEHGDMELAEKSLFLRYNDCQSLQIIKENGEVANGRYSFQMKNECTGEKSVHNLSNTGEGREDSFHTENEICLTPDCYYTFILKRDGIVLDTQIILSSRNVSESQSIYFRDESPRETPVEVQTTKNILPKVEKGDIITLRNIYYDYNESNIRRGAARELDALAVVLKNKPSLKIELIAHTDSRGSADYNLKLSLERAEAALEYLAFIGIDRDRMTAIGYGENNIKNHCVDGVECGEEEHEFNRRTEVRILE